MAQPLIAKKSLIRVQSAHERGARTTEVSGSRRTRPDNRPKYVDKDHTILKEIDEFISDSDGSKTQVIFSGHHTTSLKDDSRDC